MSTTAECERARKWYADNKDRARENNRRFQKWAAYKPHTYVERYIERYLNKIASIWALRTVMAQLRIAAKDNERRPIC